MIPKIRTLAGAALLAVGIAVMALSFSTAAGRAPGASAGITCNTVTPVQTNTPTNTPDPTPTNTPTPTPEKPGPFIALGKIPDCTATPTRTTEPRRTRTPTPAATETAAASVTAVATNTGVPATSVPTQPGGGAGAGGVRPPDTGNGPSGGDGAGTWAVAAGALLMTLGGGTVLAGAKRRH